VSCFLFGPCNGYRARYGKDSIVVSDIIKPAPNVYDEGEPILIALPAAYQLAVGDN